MRSPPFLPGFKALDMNEEAWAGIGLFELGWAWVPRPLNPKP